MKKKLLSLLIVISMVLVSACGGGTVATTEASLATEEKSEEQKIADLFLLPLEDIWDASASGIIFTKNERLKNAKGGIFKYDLGEVSPGAGLIMFAAVYAAMAKDDYLTLSKSIAKIIEDEGPVTDIQEITGSFFNRVTSLFNVYAIKGGSTLEDLRLKLVDIMQSEKDVEEFFDESVITPIGGINGWHYFYIYTNPEKISSRDLSGVGKYKNDFLDLLSHADEYKNDIKLKMPIIEAPPQVTSKIFFLAKDLDGNNQIGEQIFRKNKITMVNIWATDCAPCVGEMPTLETLSKEFEKDGYGVIGIITDGEVKKDDAKEILKDTGVTFTNVCMNSDLQRLLQVQVTPTTYFVDEKGNVLGDPIYGARSAEQYKKELNNRLALIK